MKKYIRIISYFLLVIMLGTFLSCGKEEVEEKKELVTSGEGFYSVYIGDSSDGTDVSNTVYSKPQIDILKAEDYKKSDVEDKKIEFEGEEYLIKYQRTLRYNGGYNFGDVYKYVKENGQIIGFTFSKEGNLVRFNNDMVYEDDDFYYGTNEKLTYEEYVERAKEILEQYTGTLEYDEVELRWTYTYFSNQQRKHYYEFVDPKTLPEGAEASYLSNFIKQ